MRPLHSSFAALLLLTPTVLAQPLVAQTTSLTGDTIIVVDASGSMWGQVDGEAKIEIARRIFADLLHDWPAEQRLGVMAYGHRRKGDCTDIEQIIEVGPVDAATAVERINALKPKGRTPLTDAVEQAAEALRYKDVPATVILLTDGIETCDRDPCQLAETLERAGVAFTGHVVGFDVAVEDQPKIACIAERTGGRFLSADSADQLDLAMRSVTIQPEPAPPATAEIILLAVNADTGRGLPQTEWALTNASDGTEAGSGSGASLKLELEAGSYRVQARVPDAEATETIQVRGGHPTTHQIKIRLPLPEATLKAPAEVPAGSQIEVHWTGPDNKGDYVTIVEQGAPEGTYTKYEYTSQGSPVKLQTPDALGGYEVRYLVGQSKRTLASAPVTLVAVSATLEAPAEVPAGSQIEVHWTGPDNKGDYVTIVEQGAPEGTYTKYEYTSQGSPVKLQTPDALGGYEVRYLVGQSKRTLASAPVTLVAVSATLEAPAEVPAGSQIEVHWTGPDNKGDYVTIVEQGAPEGTYTKYEYTSQGSPVKLQTPDALGGYEVRYLVGQSKRTLASYPVTLVPVSAKLIVEGPVVPGAKIPIQWQGPNNRGDYVTIVEQGAPEGTYTKYEYTSQGSPVRIQAPTEPGDYEVRYVVGQSKRTLVSLPLRVDAPAVTLSVAGAVSAGGVVDVTFEGPGRFEDMIEIVPKGAGADTKAIRSTRASQGSPVKLFAPPSPGEYQLRYRHSDTGEVAASIPLTVE